MMSVNRFMTPGVLLLAAGIVGTRILAQNGPPAPIRTDIAGDWTVVTHEDTPNYAPGPDLGDYTGLPLNAADRQKAEAWDATILSQPERQTQAHPIQYISNNRGPRRILKILDPITQVQVAYALAGSFGRADRVVWMDGRNHPSDYAEHTWDGFSTGVWEDGALVVTTTHLKQGVLRRNGVALSPYEKLVEHFFRHGLYMTVTMWIDDPIFLDEPEMRTYTEVWTPDGNLTYGEAFQAVDELGDKPLGWVPFFPLGVKHPEFAESLGLPFEVTQGGVEMRYPEYQLKIQQLLKDEAAKKAQATKKGTVAAVGAAKDPLFGTWVLDRAQSTFSDNPVDQRTMTFEAASGGGIRHVVETVRQAANNGFPVSYELAYTAKFDGKEYPAGSGSTLDTVSLKRIDAQTIERTGRIKGQTIEVARWLLSPDGRVLTITTNGTPPMRLRTTASRCSTGSDAGRPSERAGLASCRCV